MQGIKKQENLGFRPVVFESVLDTIAGGANIDTSSIPEYIKKIGTIPAGTLVGEKEEGTGLHSIIVSDDEGKLSSTPLGMIYEDTLIDDNPLVSIVICGTVRKAMLHESYQNSIEEVKQKLPKITII